MATVEVRINPQEGRKRRPGVGVTTFRRAGHEFGPAWQTYELDAPQLKAVEDEPLLEVRKATPEKKGPEKKDATAGKGDKAR